MKKILFAFCAIMVSQNILAVYTGLSSQVVAYDAINGYVTVRIYAEFSSPSDQLISLTGNAVNPFSIVKTGTGNFYQNPFGGGNTLVINPAFYGPVPQLVYDSWITIGDDDQVGNVMSSFTVSYTNFETGGDLIINPAGGGGLFAGPGAPQCFPLAGKVLLGQITVNCNVTWTCNISWQNASAVVSNELSESIFIEGGDPGCTNSYALNFDAAATLDDASCTFNPPGYEGLSYEVVSENAIAGYNTYRVYGDFTYDGDQVAAVFGQDVTPLSISTTGTFYQNVLGGAFSSSINQALFGAQPDLQYDSWVTIGSESGPNSLYVLNVNTTSFESGGPLTINDPNGGAWYVLPDEEVSAFPNVNGKVLLAQLTSNGDISIQLNVQYRAANGSSPQMVNQTLEIPFVQSSCPGDFTGDGQVGSADLLIFLAGFGCSSSCPTDLTGDDQSGTADLLVFLSVFGTICP
jgi:hypothetical protein